MSYMWFPLKPLLIVAGLGLIVALGAAIGFAFQNPASKTIALATATLLGVAALFGLQLFLELRGSEEPDFVSVELTLDRAKPVLRQWRYSAHGGSAAGRLTYEEGASAWLAQHSPTAFSGDRERLTYDLALAEILVFFARQQFDWQLATTSFKGSMFGQVTVQPVSKEGDCTQFGPADFAAALRKAGNAFAGYESLMFPGRRVCLPPDTRMTVTSSSLTLSNPFGSLQFTLVPGSLAHLEPRTGNEPSPSLPNGEPQFETRLFGIRVVNRQTALYSQHRDAEKQAAWRKRVISGLHSWFEQP